MSSAAASCSRIPAIAPPLRMSRPTTRHHRNSGTVTPAPCAAAASHWPAMTAGRPAASTATSDNVVTGFVTGPVMTPAVAARAAGAPPARRTNQLATGPPITPPSTSPIVADIMVKPMMPSMLYSAAKRSA